MKTPGHQPDPVILKFPTAPDPERGHPGSKEALTSSGMAGNREMLDRGFQFETDYNRDAFSPGPSNHKAKYSSDELVTFLQHPNFVVRAMAACELGARGVGTAIPDMIEAGRQDPHLMKTYVIPSIRSMGSAARNHLLELRELLVPQTDPVTEKEGYHIKTVAETIASVGGIQAAAMLAEGAHSKFPETSMACITQLYDFRQYAEDLVPTLKALISQEGVEPFRKRELAQVINHLGYSLEAGQWHEWYLRQRIEANEELVSNAQRKRGAKAG